MPENDFFGFFLPFLQNAKFLGSIDKTFTVATWVPIPVRQPPMLREQFLRLSNVDGTSEQPITMPYHSTPFGTHP